MEIMNMKLKMMATLWDNTYRVAIDDGQGKYIGTARVVVNVPLPPEALPENAPQVEAQLLVLVEDFDEEMVDRIKKHQERRGEIWNNFEVPLHLADEWENISK
uniref:bifunctional adenosylcobinamide kinase/adenosylcobinamide-phosphate guanylyltransferase n=1 Tax=Veillonella sp. TaxID=1926307 RepID=UPI00359F32DE